MKRGEARGSEGNNTCFTVHARGGHGGSWKKKKKNAVGAQKAESNLKKVFITADAQLRHACVTETNINTPIEGDKIVYLG